MDIKAELNVKTDSGYNQLKLTTMGELVSFDKEHSDLISTNVQKAIIESRTKSYQEFEDTDKKVNSLSKFIGVLSALKTTVKSNLVGAINELYDKIIGKTLTKLSEVIKVSNTGNYVDAMVVKELNTKVNYDIDYTATETTNTIQKHRIYTKSIDMNLLAQDTATFTIPNGYTLAWIDLSNSYLYGKTDYNRGVTYPLSVTYEGGSIGFRITKRSNNVVVETSKTGDWSNYNAWITVRYY